MQQVFFVAIVDNIVRQVSKYDRNILYKLNVTMRYI